MASTCQTKKILFIFQWTGLPCSGRQVQKSSGSTPTCVRTLDCCVCFPALQLKLYVAHVFRIHKAKKTSEIIKIFKMHFHTI